MDEAAGEVGHCSWEAGGCPMDAWVADPRGKREWTLPFPGPDGRPDTTLCAAGGALHDSAICSAEAHEIGHWCLQSEDEDAVEAWALAVNLEAVRRLP
jgi:hypothetical protein